MAHDYLKKSIEEQTGRASDPRNIKIMGGIVGVN